MSDDLVARLSARGRQVALAAAARLRRRVEQRWDGYGSLTNESGGVRLSGPGVASRRRGSRISLPDPQLLWPGDE
ncbi:hypothetical protein [Sandarakinorhabdus oryzae]|uniref:hypothetical protein n=1 Tax=Sandarakinorhabdus oryzae TaxID=2675220 RepID=UPI0012E2B586|nr:hypothetical protein [Sandarakinorhabdus oryzae]